MKRVNPGAGIPLLSGAGQLCRFAGFQVLVQLAGFAAGLVVVRALGKAEFAAFTLATALLGTLAVLSDSGVGSGVSALGGRLWWDRGRMGQLVREARRLRGWLGAGALLVVVPLYGGGVFRAGGVEADAVFPLVAIVGATLLFSIHGSLGAAVLQLNGEFQRLQHIALGGSLLRLGLLLGLATVYLDAPTALGVGLVAAGLDFFLKRRAARRFLRPARGRDPPLARKLRRVVRNQVGPTLFYAFQGQLAVLLLALFGTAEAVAEIGALLRVAVLFSVLDAIKAQIFLPAFARAESALEVRRVLVHTLGGCAGAAALLLLPVAAFPGFFLGLLGPGYGGLVTDLRWAAAIAVADFVVRAAVDHCQARAWLQFAWVTPWLVLATQVVALPLFDLGTVRGVILFSALVLVPRGAMAVFLLARGLRGKGGLV